MHFLQSHKDTLLIAGAYYGITVPSITAALTAFELGLKITVGLVTLYYLVQKNKK